jgi:putative transposase
MPKPALTTLSETQTKQAIERFAIIRPIVEEGATQAHVARSQNLPPSTVQRWTKNYREKGLAGLAHAPRSDKGKSRALPEQAVRLIEGLALQTPPRSAASIHRQMVALAAEQGWKPPSYARVRQIIKGLSPALVTLAHKGAAAYREEFDLVYLREATHSNAMWQADHTLLDVYLLDEAGKPAQPYLTVIEDDYSRAIAGYRLSFQEPTALTTALTLRTAIWRKEDPPWHVCGIPSTFYTDHGSDFTSKHLEAVAIDLGIELIFSEKGVPRGRGKVERFFRTVNQLFLQDILGYAPSGYKGAQAQLTLAAFDQQFRTWLLSQYHARVHSETNRAPQDRWEAEGYLPRMPESVEQLDLLLLTVAKTRRVQQDGIHFQGNRYIEPTLAAFVKEEVTIRYDPADMGQIQVFYQDRALCRAICEELSGCKVSLKQIEKARSERRQQLRAGLSTRAALVEQFLSVHQQEMPPPEQPAAQAVQTAKRSRLKRYLNE